MTTSSERLKRGCRCFEGKNLPIIVPQNRGIFCMRAQIRADFPPEIPLIPALGYRTYSLEQGPRLYNPTAIIDPCSQSIHVHNRSLANKNPTPATLTSRQIPTRGELSTTSISKPTYPLTHNCATLSLPMDSQTRNLTIPQAIFSSHMVVH